MNRINAQCGCSQGQAYPSSVVYHSEEPGTLGPEALLIEGPEDPATLINLTVVVHDQAIVTVNGEETVTKGSVRPYIVRGLQPDKSYKFEIVGVVRQPKGDVYAAKETVTLKAGDSRQVVLKVRRANRADFPPPEPKPAIAPPAAPPAK